MAQRKNVRKRTRNKLVPSPQVIIDIQNSSVWNLRILRRTSFILSAIIIPIVAIVVPTWLYFRKDISTETIYVSYLWGESGTVYFDNNRWVVFDAKFRILNSSKDLLTITQMSFEKRTFIHNVSRTPDEKLVLFGLPSICYKVAFKHHLGGSDSEDLSLVCGERTFQPLSIPSGKEVHIFPDFRLGMVSNAQGKITVEPIPSGFSLHSIFGAKDLDDMKWRDFTLRLDVSGGDVLEYQLKGAIHFPGQIIFIPTIK